MTTIILTTHRGIIYLPVVPCGANTVQGLCSHGISLLPPEDSCMDCIWEDNLNRFVTMRLDQTAQTK